MQDFTMDYDLPSGYSDVRLLFEMQILDDCDMSFKFTLSIQRYLMPYIGIIIRCHQKNIENDIEPAGVSKEMHVSCDN